MDIFSIFTLLGGIGLFLYGISLLGSSLEKLAGSGLERILERLTTSKRKGVGAMKGFGLGIGVTGIIQSSAATTIMLIGFVNAGIMTLVQAIPVVYGANIGSTVTAQILRLGDLGDSSIILRMLKPSSFAPIIVAIGAFILLLTKKKRLRDVANIFIGFGILFIGMTTMETVFEPLRDSETFKQAFTSFENPFLGVAIGLIITAIIQSSSASVGILQAMSATGSITYATAIPIIIGQNIGKCMTIILGSIGTNKKAKRVSLSYLMFNIFGAAFFLLVIYGINMLHPFSFWATVVNRGDIANIHLGFNVLTSFLLLPFCRQMEAVTTKLTGTDEEEALSEELKTLDPMLLNTPTVALEQCNKVMASMGDAILENYRLSTGLIYDYNEKDRAKLDENESFIDKCESSLSEYLLQITSKRLTVADRKLASELLNCISDFERMGDHCINIAYVAQSKQEQNIHFSPRGRQEIDYITKAVLLTLETTFHAFKKDDLQAAYRIEPLEETIDIMKETIKSHHIERLQTGDCGIPGGIALVDLVTSYERISSHCANVALHIVKKLIRSEHFDDMHGHLSDAQSRATEEHKAMLHYYQSRFIEPILNTSAPIITDSEANKAAENNKQELLEEISKKEERSIEKKVKKEQTLDKIKESEHHKKKNKSPEQKTDSKNKPAEEKNKTTDNKSKQTDNKNKGGAVSKGNQQKKKRK